MKQKISILAVLLLVLCVNVSKAQLYEISLDQKLQNSTLIIEGKVIKSEAFRGNDEHIYTAHDIEAFSILKGNLQDLQDQKITIITYGGTLDEEVETWTHLLTLSKNDVGVFFLTATNRPIPNENKAFYEVYSSSQGFLKYTENDFQEVVAIAPFNYHQKNDLLQNIRQSTGQFTPVFADNDGSPEDVTGVEYSIQNVSLSGNVLDFDIYVEGLWGSYDLTESELLIEYDPTVLGQNVQSNGVLSISPGIVSSSPNYSLSVNDVNPDRVSINVKALNTGFTLYTISSVPEQLLHVQIVSPASGNPDIEFDEAAMQQLSEYLDANSGVEAFQQVFAVGKVEDISGGGNNTASPNISHFYPDTLRSGTNDTLTIIGSDFDTIRGNSTVKFTTANEGPNGSIKWVSVLDSNYLYWSSDTIKVIVPSIGFENNSSTISRQYAGTGKVRVRKTAISYSTSSDDLYIPYSVRNNLVLNENIRAFLGDDNNQGGYNLYLTANLKSDSAAVAAFSRALERWRCLTLVNYQIVDTILPNNCEISFDPLPVGTTTTLGGTINTSGGNCLTAIPSVEYQRRGSFSMIFNNDPALNWYTDSLNRQLGQDTFDLESVAMHELGHALLLNHTNNPDDLMFFDYGSSTIPKREPEVNDLDGANYILNFSSTPNSPTITSCPQHMVLINQSECSNIVNTDKIKVPHLDLILFPNPTQDLLYIKSESNEDYYVKIINSTGQVIDELRFWQGTHEIDFTRYSSGIYFIMFHSEDVIHTYKIIKN
ncbi:MAG: T9SS type A sorting domain-containing protein [Saprospiraceae bacterium]